MTEKSLVDEINTVVSILKKEIQLNKLSILSSPDLMLKIRKVTSSEHASNEEVVECIKHDVNISGRLIKVANSASIGLRQPVTSVRSAVNVLGQNKVRALVTGLVIAQQFVTTKTKGLESYCTKTWNDSHNVAAIAFVLASRKTRLDPEQALLAGIVHNIGVLPVIMKLNQISSLKEDPKRLQKVAEIVIPKLYKSTGKLILNVWKFPPDIVNIAHSHTTGSDNETSEVTLDDIIFLAHQLNSIGDLKLNDARLDALSTSSAFNKVWPNKKTAYIEMVTFENEIKDLRLNLIS